MTVIYGQHTKPITLSPEEAEKSFIKALSGQCIDSTNRPDWWTYKWCFRNASYQVQFDHEESKIVQEIPLGKYIKEESLPPFHEKYKHHVAECVPINSKIALKRTANVRIRCCDKRSHRRRRTNSGKLPNTFIDSVQENAPCVYEIDICSDHACDYSDGRSHDDHYELSPLKNKLEENQQEDRLPTEADIRLALKRTREMFYRGYDAYMTHALPDAELRPLSCTGGNFDLVKVPMVTLIDTLDTLVIMGDYEEFRRAVWLVGRNIHDFDIDVNISVFETTIRVLGGLLSAHMMAIDPKLGIYGGGGSIKVPEPYDGRLLELAKDLGIRMLPAFDTITGIPYGTVNLRLGVPKGETEIASTAGAGTLLIEFEVLSRLTGDKSFGDAAMKATKALYDRRSSIGLLGKHIHTRTGKWFESVSGIGSNSDSFYEYLLKSYLLFRDNSLYGMFVETYHAVKEHVQHGDWFSDVDMFSGKSRRHRSEMLQAFWPGIEAILGLCSSSAQLLNAFYAIWNDMGLYPEEFDYVQWKPGKVPNEALYLLRPELIESTYHHYRVTKDKSWIGAGIKFLSAVDSTTRTNCGHASVKNIATGELVDSMPSFFLSETCKYLYLLFDSNSFIHDRAYIFSTEAHPFDPSQIRDVMMMNNDSYSNISTWTSFSSEDREKLTYNIPLIPMSCDKLRWWQKGVVAYDSNFIPTHEEPVLKSAHTLEEEGKGWISRLQGLESNSDGSGVGDEDNIEVCFAEESNFNHNSKSSDNDRGKVNEKRAPGPGHGPFAPPPPNKALQTLKVSMGNLGEFLVDVYQDGFIVKSETDKDIIEISGVGHGVLFVRNTLADGTSNMVMDDGAGHVVLCMVKLVDALTGEEVGSHNCAIAGYGPTGPKSSSLFKMSGEEENSNNHSNTKPKSHPPHQRDVVEEDMKAEAEEERDESEDDSDNEDRGVTPLSVRNKAILPSKGNKYGCEPPPEDKWSAWKWLTGSAGNSDPSKTSNVYDSGMVLIQRGQCLFEEKSLMAQKHGASAVVVVNSENNLFMMVGKGQEAYKRAQQQQQQEKESQDSDSSSTNSDTADNNDTDPEAQETFEDLDIPSVMVTKDDGLKIQEKIKEMADVGRKVEMQLDVDAVPMSIFHEYMGYNEYPKIHIRERLIHILGDGRWGVMLSSNSGVEWQLFILSKNDMHMASLGLIDAIDSSRQPVCPRQGLSESPVKAYENIIARKCSNTFTFENAKIKLN